MAICWNQNWNVEMVFFWIYEKDDDEISLLGKFMKSKLNVTFIYIIAG